MELSMKWIKNRMREPSTWAGVGILAGAGQVIAADPKNPGAWLAAIAGLASAMRAETGGRG